ncbi:hypothetical protein ACX80I_12305 [Arthrobacter sp. MDT3-44]
MVDRTAPARRTHGRKGSGRKRWSDLTGRQKAGVLVLASVQLSLVASAWADLATRPRDQVNGNKGTWAAVIPVNFFGPILYFWKGIRR